MGRKSKPKATVQPFCFYCDREFDDEKTLIMHQKAKHFKCLLCHKKMVTTTALNTHMQQVHKEKLIKVPNAKAGRDGLEFEIYGMEGVPEEFLVSEPSTKRQRVHGVEDGTDDDDDHSGSATAANAQSSAAAAANPYSGVPPGMHPYPFPPGMMMMPYGFPGMVPYGSGPPSAPPGFPPYPHPFPHAHALQQGPRPAFSIPSMPGAVPPGAPLPPGLGGAMVGGTGSIHLGAGGGGPPRPPMPMLHPAAHAPVSHALPAPPTSSLPVPLAAPTQPQTEGAGVERAEAAPSAGTRDDAAPAIPPSALAAAPPVPGQHLVWSAAHESQEECRARASLYAYNAAAVEEELASLQAGLDERLAAILG